MTECHTRQELFSNAWNGLKRQKWKRSMRCRDLCGYRGLNGRRCAIGFNISDDNYDSSIEGYAADVNDVRDAARISKSDAVFASDMQKVHDQNRAGMEEAMRVFADENNLTIPGEPK